MYAFTAFILVANLILSIDVYSQTSIISERLHQKMLNSSDDELIRVLIFFKDKKIFTYDEIVLMHSMSKAEKQTYVTLALKEFTDLQQAQVLNVIKRAEKEDKARLIKRLWAAYGISCEATNEIVETISNMPGIRRIKWDPFIPQDELLDHLDLRHGVENSEFSNSPPEWGLDTIKAPAVWDLGYTGQNTVVAILDDGCNYNHSDLSDHMWDGSDLWYDRNSNGIEDPDERLYHHGWDIINNDNDPIDGGEHGTPVAGIVAGDGTCGKQTGVAYDAQLMIIRCTISEGTMMGGFQWLFDMKAQWPQNFEYPDVINMSASIKFDNKPSYEAWRDLCYNVLSVGIVHTNSTGNQGSQATVPGGCNGNDPFGYPIPYNIPAPANVPPAWLHPDQPSPLNTQAIDNHVNSVIACGATNKYNEVYSESGRGPAAWENLQYFYPCQYDIEPDFWDYLYSPFEENVTNPLIKPDVTAPGGGANEHVLWSTRGSGGCYVEFSGTSSATPHVAGTAALILSANNSLTPAQVSQILQETAIELGDPGKDNEYGAGRIDAYQAVLLALAFKNYSIDNNSTFTNSARHLVRSGGYLHETFSSGGEIFYRRSPDEGQSWDITRRVTTGNGGNNNPCLTTFRSGSEDWLHLAWQRDVGNNTYQVWYSRARIDVGEMEWSSPVILPGADQLAMTSYQAGAVPVISPMNGGGALFAFFCGNASLLYRTSSNNGVSWSTPSGNPLSTGNLRYPSTSAGFEYLPLIYDKRPTSQGVYSRTFNGSSWSSEGNPASGTGMIYNRNASITADDEGNLWATWRGQASSSSPYSIVVRKGYPDNTWENSWYHIFSSGSSVSYLHPSISYYKLSDIDKEIHVIHTSSDNQILLKKYQIHFNNWYGFTQLSANGKWPDNSEETYTAEKPISFWTTQSGPPYSIELYNEGGGEASKLAPAGNETPAIPLESPSAISLLHKRRGVIEDEQSGAFLALEVDPVIISHTNGTLDTLEFKKHSVSEPVDITLENFGDYLGTEAAVLLSTAQTLQLNWSASVYSGTDSSGTVHPNLFNGKYTVLLHLIDPGNPTPLTSINITNQPSVSVNLNALAGNSIIIRPKVLLTNVGLNELIFGMGDVHYEMPTALQNKPLAIEDDADLPIRKFALYPNFPNPFNPTTTIKFYLTENALVELKIYTIQGRLIKTLVKGEMAGGNHQVQWDGKDNTGRPVASGVYIYRLQVNDFVQSRKMVLLR